MAAPVLRLMSLDKTGMTEQQQSSPQQQQQHEKSPEKSPTVKTDDTDFTQAIDQFTAAIELNHSNYTLYSNSQQLISDWVDMLKLWRMPKRHWN